MGDPVSQAYLTGGGHEQDVDLVEMAIQILRPGDLFLDVGSFLGTFSLAAASVGCRVIAIDASPLNAELLKAAAVLNGFDDLQVINAAADEHQGEIDFWELGPFGMVAASRPAGRRLRVKSLRIDDVLDGLGAPCPGLVKIDVEGSEVRALRGMRNLLAGPGAPSILFESNGHTLHLSGTTTTELLHMLEQIGYAIYMADRRELRPASSADLQAQTVVNYLATKKGPPTFAGWQPVAPLSGKQKMTILLGEVAHGNQDRRAYVASVLERAGPEFLHDREIIRILNTLSEDSDLTVREAAAWWSGT